MITHLSECIILTWSLGCKTILMLNLAEHDFFLRINFKMPTIVGISTYMSRKNSILGLYEPEKCLIS